MLIFYSSDIFGDRSIVSLKLCCHTVDVFCLIVIYRSLSLNFIVFKEMIYGDGTLR